MGTAAPGGGDDPQFPSEASPASSFRHEAMRASLVDSIRYPMAAFRRTTAWIPRIHDLAHEERAPPFRLRIVDPIRPRAEPRERLVDCRRVPRDRVIGCHEGNAADGPGGGKNRLMHGNAPGERDRSVTARRLRRDK
jgi:hypothetical protein